MNNPNYESVRKAVIAACPELMELSFGCKAEYDQKTIMIWYKFDYDRKFPDGPDFNWFLKPDGGSVLISNSDIDRYKIIGHTIRLSHVLRTMTQKWRRDSEGHFVFFGDEKSKILCLVSDWDLTHDDLALQSPETWEALDKMLSV